MNTVILKITFLIYIFIFFQYTLCVYFDINNWTNADYNGQLYHVSGFQQKNSTVNFYYQDFAKVNDNCYAIINQGKIGSDLKALIYFVDQNGIKISETILDQEDHGQTQLLLTDPLKEEIFYTYLDKKRIKIGFLKSDGESTKESEKPSSALYVPDVNFDYLKASIGGNMIYLISQHKYASQKLYVQIYDINYNIDLPNFLVQSFETIKTFHWGLYTLTLSKSDYIVINAGLEENNTINEKIYSINSIDGKGSLIIGQSTVTIYQNLVSTDSNLNNKFNSIPNTNLQVILMGDKSEDILNIITIDVEQSSQNYIHKVCDSTEYDLYNGQNYKYLDSGIINEYFGYIKAGNPASFLFFNPTTCKFYKYGQQFLRYDDITFEQESTTFYTQDIQGYIYLYVQQQNDVKRITIPPPSLYCQVWDQNQVCIKCVEQKVQKLLVNNKCNCPINYYLDNNTGECQLKCDIRCSDLGCDDNGNCYNCAQNHYFQGNNCIKCPSICSDCNTQYKLKNITYSQYLDTSNYQNLTNQCGCDKVPGYYYCLNNATQTQHNYDYCNNYSSAIQMLDICLFDFDQ